jgi:hypothetical protein
LEENNPRGRSVGQNEERKTPADDQQQDKGGPADPEVVYAKIDDKGVEYEDYDFDYFPHVRFGLFGAVLRDIVCEGVDGRKGRLCRIRIGDAHPVGELQSHGELQGVDGIEPQSFHEKSLVVPYLLWLNVVQVGGFDDYFFQVQLQIRHCVLR